MRCFRAKFDKNFSFELCKFGNVNESCSFECSTISLYSCKASERYIDSSLVIDKVVMIRDYCLPIDERKPCNELQFDSPSVIIVMRSSDEFEFVNNTVRSLCKILISRSIII